MTIGHAEPHGTPCTFRLPAGPRTRHDTGLTALPQRGADGEVGASNNGTNPIFCSGQLSSMHRRSRTAPLPLRMISTLPRLTTCAYALPGSGQPIDASENHMARLNRTASIPEPPPPIRSRGKELPLNRPPGDLTSTIVPAQIDHQPEPPVVCKGDRHRPSSRFARVLRHPKTAGRGDRAVNLLERSSALVENNVPHDELRLLLDVGRRRHDLRDESFLVCADIL